MAPQFLGAEYSRNNEEIGNLSFLVKKVVSDDQVSVDS